MKYIWIAALLLAMVALPTSARADVAPPAQPPGSNPAPGVEATNVRMAAETVLIDVQPAAPSKSLGQAHVTADFNMHNTGAAAESMTVRFPLGASDGWSRIKQIAGLVVQVNGKGVAVHQIMGEDPYGSSSPVPWAAFDVTFPPGQDLPIRVQYTLEASGEYPFVSFKYVLSSGAGWKDTIGSADIILQLPYAANIQNTLLDVPDSGFSSSAGGVRDGNTIRWHYSDLEPQPQDNFEVYLVMPSAWEQLLREQAAVASDPTDGEAWGRLGKVSKELAFSSRRKGFRGESGKLDAGAAQLYQQAFDAYAKAVALLPNDALWHAGYADLLAYHAYFAGYTVDTTQEAIHSLREIQLALALAPNDAKVQEIAAQIAGSFPDGMRGQGSQYDFPWLTATPAPKVPTATATLEVAQLVPTATIAPPAASPTTPPAPTPTPKPSAPLCGGAMLLPAAVAFIALSASRRKARR